MNLLETIQFIFSPGSFEPHRVHFFEHPELMWFIVIGNALVALAYFLIPIALAYFVRRRKDLVFHWTFLFFAAFIFFCGWTHVMHIVIFWYPVYWVQGIVDTATGFISLATALSLIHIIPLALKLPSPEQLRKVNTSLQQEIVKKEKAERQVRKLNKYLEKRVKERTQKLEEAYRELQEAEKRKDDFISIASHELKTPLTSMNAYVYGLKKKLRTDKDPYIAHYMDKIERQIGKQAKLVADLLDITRMQAGKLYSAREPFILSSVVKERIEDIQSVTQTHTIAMKGEIKHKVVGDPERIGQVVTNLLSNAIKFSPQAETIDVTMMEKKNKAIVTVRDYGMGIDAWHIKKIFERFYRVYDDHGKTFPGFGIGLYLASKIIEQHNGAIWAESTKGKGSSFSFSLPLLNK